MKQTRKLTNRQSAYVAVAKFWEDSIYRENGKIGGPRTKELGLGIHGLSEEERIENASKGGKLGGERTKELGVGLFGLSEEERIENASKAGKISWQLNKDKKFGIHGLSEEERKINASNAGTISGELNGGKSLIEWIQNPDNKEQIVSNAKLGGERTKELGVGIHGLSKEERIENAAKGGSIGGGPRPSTFNSVLVWKWDKETKSKGEFVGEYVSMSECGRILTSKFNIKINKVGISGMIRKKQNQHKGFVFEKKS